DRLPFRGGDGGQFQLLAVHAQLRLTAPVPVLAVVVGTVHAQAEQGFQMLGYFVPLGRVGEVGADPGACDVVGKEVLGDVVPALRVVLGDAGPGDVIKLVGRQRHFDGFPGQRHRNDAEAGEDLAGGGQGEDALDA